MEQSRTKKFLLYLFAFWLLWEWLMPLETVSDTKNVGVFIAFIAFCFLLSFLQVRFWLAACLKLGYIFYAVNHLFFHAPFFSFLWMPKLLQEVIDHIPIIAHFRWIEMTDVFRSFLFFLLLWMLTYLVQYWLFIQRRILLFYATTVAYVSVLDTFTAFRGNGAIVRLVAGGFFLLSWLQYEKLPGTKQYKKWLFVCTASISLSIFAGYIGPKLVPQWPDPIAFIKRYTQEAEQGTSGSSVKKIGYGNNDSQLGGPFIADNAIVFTAEDKQDHYWRVETKDIYTGKGWIARDDVQIQTFADENNVHRWFEDGVKKEVLTAKVHTAQPYTYLIYPEGLKKVKGPEGVVFRLQVANEKIYPTDRESYIFALQEYELTYEYPTFSVEQLKAARPLTDEQMLKRYTQLPESLPKRVRELAQRIVAGKTTTYDKVKAIEQYFHLNGFVYETKDVAVPRGKQDYVDQFLFETKKGYCDNFSTSMVVLLRSLHIPARWVKGYTSGQWISKTDDGKNVYSITNKNAHSWVEVYFSGIGWVPFEPTQGFSNPYEFTQPVSEVKPAPAQQSPHSVEKRTKLNDVLRGEQVSSTNWKDKIATMFDWRTIVELMIGCAAIAWLLYRFRRKWWPYITLWMFRQKHGNELFIKAYVSLLRHLKDYGLKKKEGQTLRQYAAYVDEWFGTKEMSQLTNLYERAIYRNENVDTEWNKIKELWENLIKRTAS